MQIHLLIKVLIQDTANIFITETKVLEKPYSKL